MEVWCLLNLKRADKSDYSESFYWFHQQRFDKIKRHHKLTQKIDSANLTLNGK